MAPGKRLPALEMPEDEVVIPDTTAAMVDSTQRQKATAYGKQSTIPLPPIPAPPRREIMVQLSIKAPLALVERLEGMTRATGAQKQAVMAAALDAYLQGHGY